MSVVFAADDLPLASRTEYWRDVLGQALVPLDPVGNPDRLVVGQAGAVGVGELSDGKPGGARRTAKHIRRADPDLYKVDVLVHGHGVVEQGDRQAHVRPGDLTLIDLSRPATWAMSAMRCVAVIFPRELMPVRAEDTARLAAVRIPGDTGPGALISQLVRRLPSHLDDWNEAAGARLGAAVLDLITVALAARLDQLGKVPAETRQRALLQRIYAFIETRLSDPELSPGNIAAAQFISVRYLHRLFETEQTTVADWVRQRRLERCRRDLADPELRAEPVGAIAARWGLTNPAHFSRLFRAAYGAAPREYRMRGG